jgi:SOS response regulatory protein OraA/RecX
MTQTRTTNSSEYMQALEALTRHLSVRDHSRLELRQKLAAKFSEETIERALENATARGWLASEEEIAARAALTWQSKLKSRADIEAQLKKRGLPIPPSQEG